MDPAQWQWTNIHDTHQHVQGKEHTCMIAQGNTTYHLETNSIRSRASAVSPFSSGTSSMMELRDSEDIITLSRPGPGPSSRWRREEAEGERREISRWTMRACAAATLSSWHASTTTKLARSFLLCSNTTGRCESKPGRGWGEMNVMCCKCHWNIIGTECWEQHHSWECKGWDSNKSRSRTN